MLGVQPAARRPRPPSRLPLHPLGARAGGRGGRGPAPPRPRRRLPRRARRGRAGARARLRRHRLRAPTGRSGAASCCAPRSTASSGSPTSTRCRCPGGEAAIREPWRIAAAYLERAGRPVPLERWPRGQSEPRRSTRRSHPGMGRLFDAAAALLGSASGSATRARRRSSSSSSPAETAAEPYDCRDRGRRASTAPT